MQDPALGPILGRITERRRFAAYWLVIEGGSGLMRRRWLAANARRAERGPKAESCRSAG